MINIHSIKDEEAPGMGHNSEKSEAAKELENTPHSTVVKAIIKGEAVDVGGVTGQRLKAFIERVERLEEEKAAFAEDIKDIFAEAKGVGFDTKTIRKVIKLRKMDKEKRHEEEELLELYKSAIGLE